MPNLADILFTMPQGQSPQLSEDALQAIANQQQYMDMVDAQTAARQQQAAGQVAAPAIPPPAAQPVTSMADVLQPQQQPADAAPIPAASPAAASQTPAAPVSSDRVKGWQQVLDSVRKPEVMEPLQTFFAALSAPKSPWENGASRLGRAAQLASMHRNMLLENMRTQPQRDQLEALKLRQEQAKTDSAEIGVTNDQATADYNATRARVAKATVDQDIQKALQEVDNLRLHGRESEARLKEAEIRLKYADQSEKLDLAIKRRAANAPYFKPSAEDGKTKAQAQDDVTSAYDSEIWAPFLQWRQSASAEGEPDISWAAFLKANPAIAVRYRQIAKDAVKAGMKMTTRIEGQEGATGTPAAGKPSAAPKNKVIEWDSIK